MLPRIPCKHHRVRCRQRSLLAREKFALQIGDGRRCLGVVEDSSGGPRAQRLGQAILVVLQQHAPGRCVADDQVEHREAFVVDQLVGFQRARQEPDGLFEFADTALAQPALVRV
jgi:hypothetical protein